MDIMVQPNTYRNRPVVHRRRRRCRRQPIARSG